MDCVGYCNPDSNHQRNGFGFRNCFLFKYAWTSNTFCNSQWKRKRDTDAQRNGKHERTAHTFPNDDCVHDEFAK